MPIEFFRVVIGIIGIGCAFMTGRTAGAVWNDRPKSSRLTGWTIRTVLCVTAIAIRHGIDRLDLIFWSLTVATIAGGWWAGAHEKPPEDLTHEIFPGEE